MRTILSLAVVFATGLSAVADEPSSNEAKCEPRCHPP